MDWERQMNARRTHGLGETEDAWSRAVRGGRMDWERQMCEEDTWIGRGRCVRRTHGLGETDGQRDRETD